VDDPNGWQVGITINGVYYVPVSRVAEARREGLREAARIVRAVIMEWQHYEDATDADALAKDVAAVILDLAEANP
jgi:hypothetical protein